MKLLSLVLCGSCCLSGDLRSAMCISTAENSNQEGAKSKSAFDAHSTGLLSDAACYIYLKDAHTLGDLSAYVVG